MKTASWSATMRPYVSAGIPARNPVACSFRKLMNPAASAMTSHFTDAPAMSSTGQRVEASISAVGGLTAQLGAADAGVGDVTEAVIKSPAAGYSKAGGFSGAFGGGVEAFSTRAIKLERNAAGFLPPSTTSCIARSIGRRTTVFFLFI